MDSAKNVSRVGSAIADKLARERAQSWGISVFGGDCFVGPQVELAKIGVRISGNKESVALLVGNSSRRWPMATMNGKSLGFPNHHCESFAAKRVSRNGNAS